MNYLAFRLWLEVKDFFHMTWLTVALAMVAIYGLYQALPRSSAPVLMVEQHVEVP